MELRVDGAMVELLLRPSTRLPTLILEEAGTEGVVGTMLEAVEKVVTDECRLVSVSTLVCKGVDTEVLTEDEVGV